MSSSIADITEDGYSDMREDGNISFINNKIIKIMKVNFNVNALDFNGKEIKLNGKA